MSRAAGTVDFTPAEDLYPFRSNWFESSVGPLHYLDEGEGQPLFLVHGNPDWSFLYRRMIPLLSPFFRCIAPDFPGFGLSVHPAGYGYMPEDHGRVLGELVEHLDLTDMIVMGQDWGGPVSMDVASRLSDRVAGLVMGNTWFWPSDDRKMNAFSRVMGSRPVQYLIRERNAMVSVAMKRSFEAPISEREMAHYEDVLPTSESRKGAALLPIAIRTAKPWLAILERRVASTLRDKPIVLIFGRKDPVLAGQSFVERWRHEFPHATVIDLPDAGHFIQHDAPDDVAQAIIAAFGPSGTTPSD